MRFHHSFSLSQWLRIGVMFVAFASIGVQAQVTSVAVAANMKDAFTEIYAAYRAAGKPALRVVYGSSGNFAAQIMNGAPFTLFISADESFPLELFKNGKTLDEGRVYATGKIALFTKNGSGFVLKDEKTELVRAIVKANKVAIAKPELAPYGRAAVEYLKATGLWEFAKDKLVYGDNINVATMFVVTGAADIGFTALSVLKSPELSKEINYILPTDGLYAPIRQRMVLIKGASQDAVDFYAFMQTHQAKNILLKYGYAVPQ